MATYVYKNKARGKCLCLYIKLLILCAMSTVLVSTKECYILFFLWSIKIKLYV